MPERESFKKVYTALKRNNRWTTDRNSFYRAAEKLGLDAGHLRFILSVFEELDFIRRLDGDAAAYEVVPSPAKKNLEQSARFQQRKAVEEWAKRMIYASEDQLARWLIGLINRQTGAGTAAHEAAASMQHP